MRTLPAMRRLAILLLLAVPYAALLAVVGMALVILIAAGDESIVRLPDVLHELGRWIVAPEAWAAFGPAGAAVVALQLAFLAPVLRWTPERADRGRPLRSSIIAVGAVAGLLTLGLLLAMLDGYWLIRHAEPFDPTGSGWFAAAALLAVAGSWLGWTFLLLVHQRDPWPDRAIGRWARLLLAGTILEVVLILPIDVMVRRRTDCYCSAGTFFALVLSAAGLVFLAGPGAFLALTRRRRRGWRRDRCARCAHRLGPRPGACCPECGAPRVVPE